MTPELFVENIASLSFRGVFNPYRDVCPIHDTEESPDMRRKNLLGFLRTALEIGADTIWMDVARSRVSWRSPNWVAIN